MARDGRRVHPDANDFGHDGWMMRNVSVITQQELQSVLSCGQRNLRLGLSGAEMNVVEVGGDRLIDWRQRSVDEKVMMTGIRPDSSRRPATFAIRSLSVDSTIANRIGGTVFAPTTEDRASSDSVRSCARMLCTL